MPDSSKCQHTCLANRRCVTDLPHTYLSQHFVAFSFLNFGSFILAAKVQIQLLHCFQRKESALAVGFIQNDHNHQCEPEHYDTLSKSHIPMEPFSNVSLRPFFSHLAPVEWVGPQRHVQVQRGEVRGLVHVRQQLVHLHVR